MGIHRKKLMSVRGVKGMKAVVCGAIALSSMVLARGASAQTPGPGVAQSAPPVYGQPQSPQGTMSNPIIVQFHPETGGIPTTVAMSGPRIINDWEEGDAVPYGYHPESRVRRGLVIGGAIPFGIFYLFSAMTAAIASDAGDDDGALYIPAIGPFIQLAKSDSSTARFFCALDGIVQTGGLAMLIYGIASPKTVLVRNDLGLQLHLRPVATRNGMGLGLGGTF